MKTPQFSIRLEGEDLVFSAHHFITFPAHEKDDGRPIVESPHCHDFRVRVKIDGPLGRDELLIDFQTARDLLLEILKDFHQKTILAVRQRGIEIRSLGDQMEVAFASFRSDGMGTFPESLRWRRSEVVTIEADNASTEAVALELAKRFFASLEAHGLLTAGPTDDYFLTFSLEEEPGMKAEVRL